MTPPRDDDAAAGRATAALPLLERERELGIFAELLGGDPAALSQPLVVEGPAGIGKSRLLAELRELAAAGGYRIAAAQGSELERAFPFGVVRQLFEPLLADASARTELLADAAASAASVFGAPAASGEEEGDQSFATLHGLYWLTVNVAAERPLLLVVDDLHWCDRPSLRFLAYLARRLEGLPAIAVVGLRTAEPGTDPLLMGEVVSAADTLALHPGPLSETGVGRLIAARLGAEPDREFVAACLAATGGNPLLLRQLLTSLEADSVRPEAGQAGNVERIGPRAVSRTVLGRLRSLAAPASEVAQAIAVLGPNAELPLVAALAECDERAVAAATAALTRAEIVRPDPPLGFVHPLVRDAVYHGLPPGERELMHARAALLLGEAGADSESIATHLLNAPQRGEERVVATLLEAAREARHKGAADSAVAYLTRALQEPPAPAQRTPLLLELGMAETLTSGPAAAEHLREAWANLQDPAARAHVAATLARTLIFTAPAEEALAVTREALRELPEELVDEAQAMRALELMAVFFGAGDQRELTGLDEQVRGEGPGARMLAAMTSFGRSITGASAAECVPMARWALEGGVLIEADPGLFPVAAIAVLVCADDPAAPEAWERLRALAHRRGSLLGILTVCLWGGWTAHYRGELADAEEMLLVAHRDFTTWGLVKSSETYSPAFLGKVRIEQGRLQEARELIDPSRIADDRTDGRRHQLCAWAELLLAEGRNEEALETAEDLATRLTFVSNPAWAPWPALKSQALQGLGRREEAIAAAELGLERALRFGAPGLTGRQLRVLGEAEGTEGIPRLAEAVVLLEGSTARLELARALLALGAVLRADRRPTEAREPLRRGLDVAYACGAGALVESIRAELGAAGGRPRGPALGGPEALTPSERRVVDLAIGGRTNKEIAQALYVTPKTVEVHLSSAYRKLDISSRRELESALAA
ncbi:MAG TPA: AAA family ATPase [Solirubrobacteraceae bacterium]|nr:AAA family ATPase [Solirubrobacteraceae bacterium]